MRILAELGCVFCLFVCLFKICCFLTYLFPNVLFCLCFVCLKHVFFLMFPNVLFCLFCFVCLFVCLKYVFVY